MLESVASSTPLLVLVDDADDATPSVREAMRFLAAAHGERCIGWVIAARDGRADHTLSLQPVSEEAAARVIASALPGIDGAQELGRIARARTGGAVGRIVDGTLALVHRGAIRFRHGQWRRRAEGLPDGAYREIDREAIDALLARLAPDAREALAAIALDGGSVARAARRLGLGGELLTRAIASAVRLGLVRTRGEDAELASREVRARLVDGLVPGHRDALRRRAIHALSDATSPDDLTVRARHLAALARHDEAVRDALAAAQGAAATGDLHGAAELLDEARTWSSAAAADVVAVALSIAAVRGSLGEIDTALRALDDALAAGASPDVVARLRGRSLARAARYEDAIATLDALRARDALDAEDRFWLGWSLMMRGRYDDAEPLVAHDVDDAAARARLGRLAGTIAWHRGRFDTARTILTRAKHDAALAGDRLLAAEVEQSLGTAERLRGHLDDAAAHYATAIDAAREHGFVTVLAKALNNLAIVEYQSGRWERARHAWEAMHELALRLDAHEEILLAHNNLALLFLDRGELDRAERSLDEAIRIAHARDLARYESMALGNRAEVRTRAKRFDEAERDLDASIAIARRIGADDEECECLRRRASIRLGRGEPGAALIEALSAAETARAAGAGAEAGHAFLLAAACARTLGRLDELEARDAHVSGDLDRLASALTWMIESASRASPRGVTLRVTETAGHGGARSSAWRPGASAGRRFVRIEVIGGGREGRAASTDTLPLRTARRIAARNGGRLFEEPSPAGRRIVMEIESRQEAS